jgi:hypothetical protein
MLQRPFPSHLLSRLISPGGCFGSGFLPGDLRRHTLLAFTTSRYPKVIPLLHTEYSGKRTYIYMHACILACHKSDLVVDVVTEVA